MMASAPVSAADTVCPTCGSHVPRGERYCPTCGEALDPELVAQLQALYAALRDLDARLAAGQGERTITALRDEYRARYLGERSAPAHTPAQVAELQWLYRTLLDLDGRIAAGQGEESVRRLRDEYAARYAATRRGPAAASAPASDASGAVTGAAVTTGQGASATPGAAPVTMPYTTPYAAYPRVAPLAAPPVPPGPAFSWRAFVQDQAISIMAYLGGFLLLIATLSFIIGAWQVLGDGVKLAIVIAVHLVFLVLGIALRRAPHLKTVSNTYLAVFALMAPLVALAVYRFALQGLSLPVAGILCIASAYATVIYLVLAWRTGFAAYGYLGWAALLAALLAGVRWIDLSGEWMILALAVYSLVLLVPEQLRRVPSLAILAGAARPISAIASAFAAIFAFVLGLAVWIDRLVSPQQNLGDWPVVLLATAGVLVLLALAWSATLHTSQVSSALRAVADTSIGGALAFAAFSAAAWLGATQTEMAYLFALLGLLELAAAVAVRMLSRERLELGRGLGGIAIALASFGALSVLADLAPNWPLLASLGVGILVGIAMTWTEHQPWWELVAGVFLLAATPVVVAALRTTGALDVLYALRPELVLASSFYAVLAIILWGLALVLAGAHRTLLREGVGRTPLHAGSDASRRYALPAYVVAVGAAMIATILLPFGASAGDIHITPQADYQTMVLGIFAIASLVVGVRERALALASIPVGFFGLLLPLPYAVQHASEGLPLSIIALVAAIVALGLRRLLGRTWAYAPYGVALWSALVAALHADSPGVDTARWSLLGISFAAGLLLVVALLALVAAWWEAHPVAMAAPAALAFLAVLFTPDAFAQAALVVGMVAVGMGLRQIRGRYWNIAWLAAAVPASLVATTALRFAADAGPWYQVAGLLVLALLGYIVAVQERVPALTLITVGYGLIALLVMPAPDNLLPTVGYTLGAVIAGIITRVLITPIQASGSGSDGSGPARSNVVPIAWTGAWYAVAGAGSIAIVLRSGVTSELLPVALLVLAALAYLVAVVERTPWITPLAAIYGLWAALVVPTGPYLLIETVALAAGAALIGALVRFTAGRAWAIALYVVGVGASLLSLTRVVPFDANTMQIVLLIYTVAACIVVAAEREPLAGIAPALYGSGAVLIQTDARLLLPLAVGFGVVGMVLGRRLNWRWALPWYIVTAVAGLATAIRGTSDPGFEPLALLALGVLVYAIAAVQALPEVLPISLILLVLTLASAAGYFQLEGWQATLAFLALSYVFTAAQWLWRALPGLDSRTSAQGAAMAGAGVSAGPSPATVPGAPFVPAPPVRVPPAPRNPRAIGAAIHQWASWVVGGVTLLVALFTPGAFTPQASETQVAAIALVAMAGLLVLQSQISNARLLLYVGGELVALAISWEVRWLGADNVQAFVLAPGSFLVLVGVLLPHDKRLRNPVVLGQWASVIGTLVLLLPTFAQTFSSGQELLYMGALTIEALIIVGVGVGTRARALVMLGAAFVGIAALRGAVLALGEGIPVFLVIAAIAVLLLGGATWLSLRSRQTPSGGSQSGAHEQPVEAAVRAETHPGEQG